MSYSCFGSGILATALRKRQSFQRAFRASKNENRPIMLAMHATFFRKKNLHYTASSSHSISFFSFTNVSVDYSCRWCIAMTHHTISECLATLEVSTEALEACGSLKLEFGVIKKAYFKVRYDHSVYSYTLFLCH